MTNHHSIKSILVSSEEAPYREISASVTPILLSAWNILPLILFTTGNVFLLVFFKTNFEVLRPWKVVYLYAPFAIILARIAYLYLDGFNYPLAQPKSNSKEDLLNSLERNIRTWTRYRYNKDRYGAKTRTLQNHMQQNYARRIGLYIADPSLSTEFSPTSSTVYAIIVILSCASGSTLFHICLRCFGRRETPGYQLILATLGMFPSFYPMLILYIDLGRLGRSSRMGRSVRHVRNICLQEDVEDGNGDTKDRLSWWIKNLVGIEAVEGVASAAEVKEVSEALVSWIKV